MRMPISCVRFGDGKGHDPVISQAAGCNDQTLAIWTLKSPLSQPASPHRALHRAADGVDAAADQVPKPECFSACRARSLPVPSQSKVGFTQTRAMSLRLTKKFSGLPYRRANSWSSTRESAESALAFPTFASRDIYCDPTRVRAGRQLHSASFTSSLSRFPSARASSFAVSIPTFTLPSSIELTYVRWIPAFSANSSCDSWSCSRHCRTLRPKLRRENRVALGT